MIKKTRATLVSLLSFLSSFFVAQFTGKPLGAESQPSTSIRTPAKVASPQAPVVRSPAVDPSIHLIKWTAPKPGDANQQTFYQVPDKGPVTVLRLTGTGDVEEVDAVTYLGSQDQVDTFGRWYTAQKRTGAPTLDDLTIFRLNQILDLVNKIEGAR